MVKTFGEEKATQIRADFDKCAEENKGKPRKHLKCLRDHFTKDEVAEMVDAIEEAGITWECEEKKAKEEKRSFRRKDHSGRPHCRPTPEAQEQIHEVMVKTFGEEKATHIRADFDKCAEENKGKPRKHVKCLRDHFTKDKVAEMVDAIEEAGITWECEEKKAKEQKREEDVDWELLFNLAPVLKEAIMEEREEDVDWELLFSIAPALKEVIKEKREDVDWELLFSIAPALKEAISEKRD